MLHLEITEAVLIHCNIINNDYQHDSRVLHTFAPDKSFGQLLDITPKKIIFLKTFNLEPRYSIEPRDLDMDFCLYAAKNMGKNIRKSVSKNLTNKYI